MPSLNAFLKEHSRLRELFSQSNLCQLIRERIMDGSLYLPKPGRKLTSVHLNADATGLCLGYMGDYHRLTFHGTAEAYDEREDEFQEKHVGDITISVPVKVADAYEITKKRHKSGFVEDIMVFAIKRKAFTTWVKVERTRVRRDRLDELTAERKKLDAAIKALS